MVRNLFMNRNRTRTVQLYSVYYLFQISTTKLSSSVHFLAFAAQRQCVSSLPALATASSDRGIVSTSWNNGYQHEHEHSRNGFQSILVVIYVLLDQKIGNTFCFNFEKIMKKWCIIFLNFRPTKKVFTVTGHSNFQNLQFCLFFFFILRIILC